MLRFSDTVYIFFFQCHNNWCAGILPFACGSDAFGTNGIAAEHWNYSSDSSANSLRFSNSTANVFDMPPIVQKVRSNKVISLSFRILPNGKNIKILNSYDIPQYEQYIENLEYSIYDPSKMIVADLNYLMKIYMEEKKTSVEFNIWYEYCMNHVPSNQLLMYSELSSFSHQFGIQDDCFFLLNMFNCYYKMRQTK